MDDSRQQVVYSQSVLCTLDLKLVRRGAEPAVGLSRARPCLLWPLPALQHLLSPHSLLMCPSCPLLPAWPWDSQPPRLPWCLESTEIPVLGGVQIWIVSWQKCKRKTPVANGTRRKAILDRKTKSSTTLTFSEESLRTKEELLLPASSSLQWPAYKQEGLRLEFWSFSLGLSHQSFHIGKAQVCPFHNQVVPRRGGRRGRFL